MGRTCASIIPALRERISDIPLLAKTILDKIAPHTKYRLTDSGAKALSRYEFRGNIRELRNLLSRATVLSDTKIIDQHMIEACFDTETRARRESSHTTPSALEWPSSKKADSQWATLRAHELGYVERALSAYAGDKDETAKVLGISVRSLYRKLQSLDPRNVE
jgi:DNA-binding NtrC family response regulator